MSRITENWLRRLGVAAVLAAGMLLPAAASADTIRLKDGRVFEGTVEREKDGYVWFKVRIGSVENIQLFRPDQVEKLERDTEAAPMAAAAPKPEERARARGAGGGLAGTPRAAVISFGDRHVGDMVGIYATAKSLQDAIPLLEAEGVDVVVMKFDSQGGFLLEIEKISDVIQNEYKPRFRTVAWIQSAISAAAMSAHCLEEIYFMPEGNYGACTGYSGQLVAMKDRDLEEVLYMMEKFSARGKYHPDIMRAMQIMEPLSATINERGEVVWMRGLGGEHVVNPEDRILTFNSKDAERFRFSRGTARTLDELTRLMGYQELDWAGVERRGHIYPISRAEDHLLKFREKVKKDEERTNEFFTMYNNNVAAAQGTEDKRDRGMFVGRARQALRSIESMVRNNPNFAFLIFNIFPVENFKYWVEDREEELRRLMR